MLTAPESLGNCHQTADFDSGVPSLDKWPKRRAAANQASGASRAFVVSDEDYVIAFCALASGAVASAEAPDRFRRNMPDPIPVVVLGRMAIATTHQGRGVGRALFQDAALHVIHAADAVGIRGLRVHASSDSTRSFYLRLGLEASLLDPMVLMAPLADLRRAIDVR